jgi:hypothetical protein
MAPTNAAAGDPPTTTLTQQQPPTTTSPKKPLDLDNVSQQQHPPSTAVFDAALLLRRTQMYGTLPHNRNFAANAASINRSSAHLAMISRHESQRLPQRRRRRATLDHGHSLHPNNNSPATTATLLLQKVPAAGQRNNVVVVSNPQHYLHYRAVHSFRQLILLILIQCQLVNN